MFFQGRYKAILVQKENYLIELARYIVLNPVCARMVHQAVDWPWSSYRAIAGHSQQHALLTADWLLSAFVKDRKEAQIRCRRFGLEGKNQPSLWESLKNQIYLGSDQFVEDMQCKLNPNSHWKIFQENRSNHRPGHYCITKNATISVLRRWPMPI